MWFVVVLMLEPVTAQRGLAGTGQYDMQLCSCQACYGPSLMLMLQAQDLCVS
jgi:hypothetical protein